MNYYRRAQYQQKWFGRRQFKIHFPQMEDCVVFKNIFIKFWSLLKYKLFYKKDSWPKSQQQLQTELPMQKPNFENVQDKIKVTWIGHATTVVSIGKKVNFIIDPIFSNKRKRYQPAACRIQDLPFISFVLISHDHYDHLDSASLSQLDERFSPTFIAGLNTSDVLPKGCHSICLDWTQSVSVPVQGKTYKITFVPSCHWSQRKIFDINKRLWGGFVIQTPQKKNIYYSGDTGYCGIFQELGSIFGGFDLSILPIGGYEPRSLLACQHINPHQAVLIHKQVRSKKSIGVHWGTFSYGCQSISQPREDLQRAKLQQKVDTQQFITVNHGGNLTIDL